MPGVWELSFQLSVFQAVCIPGTGELFGTCSFLHNLSFQKLRFLFFLGVFLSSGEFWNYRFVKQLRYLVSVCDNFVLKIIFGQFPEMLTNLTN